MDFWMHGDGGGRPCPPHRQATARRLIVVADAIENLDIALALISLASSVLREKMPLGSSFVQNTHTDREILSS
jgi:hypothetical protein